MDIFKSEPLPDAIENDWRFQNLVLDVTNSLGETFHFEIRPGDQGFVPLRQSDRPDSKRVDNKRATIVNMLIGGG